MSQPLKSRREIEEFARKEHILNIAERLFADQGLMDTSMADIAKEAEFGVGTIYKYFKDKNTLIQSLLETRLEDHFDDVEEALAGDGAPEDIIAQVIDTHLASVESKRLFFNIYYTHFHPGTLDGYGGYSGGLDHRFMYERKKRMIKNISAVFKTGTEAGRFTDVAAEFLTSALFGMLISFSFLDEHRSDENWDLKEKQDALKKIFFNAVQTVEQETLQVTTGD